MKNKNFNKRRLANRIIAFPFVFAIMFIAHNIFVLKRMWHYLKFGGEYVNFEENERETISGIFEMLKEIKENQNNK